MKPGFRDDGFILGKRMMIPDRRAHRYQQPPDQRQSVSNDICLWRYRFLTAREYEVPLGTQQRGSPMTKRIVSMVAVAAAFGFASPAMAIQWWHAMTGEAPDLSSRKSSLASQWASLSSTGFSAG